MGLGVNGASMDSPPLRPTPPRRLSETNAATTLAFFKQQSPPDPRPVPTPPSQAPPHSHPHAHPHQHPHPHPHMHQHPPQPHPHSHPHPHVQIHPVPPAPVHHAQPHHPIPHDSAGGSIRKKQKYTIKNVEAWGERHGRPAAHDPSGRALWKRPSDGNLVYLTCPIPGCAKSDFVTLHGFMCHLTKKHKDRSLGSQSRALEVCGVVFDPNVPLPPVPTRQRASTEESRLESAPTDQDGYPQEMEYSTGSDEEEDQGSPYPVKMEITDKPFPPHTPQPGSEESTSAAPAPPTAAPKTNGSTKQSISSIIDRNPEGDSAVSMPPPPTSTETPTSASQEQTTPVHEKSEVNGSSQSAREASEPKEASETKSEAKQ